MQFIAPEVFLSGMSYVDVDGKKSRIHYDQKVDAWSLGVTLFYMLVPFTMRLSYSHLSFRRLCVDFPFESSSIHPSDERPIDWEILPVGLSVNGIYTI